MKVEWLRMLAARLQWLLADYGTTVSGQEALDLIAVVPESHDWSEVLAFPDRVVHCRFDEDAVERLARNILGRHALTIALERLIRELQWMSLFYRSRDANTATKRLIITTDASGAGHLKQSGIADRVIQTPEFDSLVSGPVPASDDPATFFTTREAAYDADPAIRDQLYAWNRADRALLHWEEVLIVCETYERIELWVDPDPNDQLFAIRLLTWLASHPDLFDKLFVVHADTRLGERGHEHFRTMHPQFVKIGPEHLATATRAWLAYGRSTPEAWYGLLDTDLEVLPHLRRTVLLLLDELPAVDTSLGATERLLLDVVAPGDVSPRRFFERNTQENPSRVFGAFDEIRILNRLAGGRYPAVLGLHDTTFTYGAEPEPERRQRYMASRLSLSSLGEALLAGTADFSAHAPIHRWWGGTLLANDRLWRWDRHRELAGPR